MNKYIMSSTEMDLKQAWSLDLLSDAMHLKKVLDLPSQMHTRVGL